MKSTWRSPLGLLLAVLGIATLFLAASAGRGHTSEAAQTTVVTTTLVTTTAPVTTTTTAVGTTTSSTTATTTSGGATTTGGDAEAALLAEGQQIWETTAGGVGCAMCHGVLADGQGEANIGAPDIRGTTKNAIIGAVQGGVAQMSFIKLTPHEIDAVSAWVDHLSGK